MCKNNGDHEYNFCVNVTVDKDHHKWVILPLLPAGVAVCAADLTLGTFYPTPHLLLSTYSTQHTTLQFKPTDLIHSRFPSTDKAKGFNSCERSHSWDLSSGGKEYELHPLNFEFLRRSRTSFNLQRHTLEDLVGRPDMRFLRLETVHVF